MTYEWPEKQAFSSAYACRSLPIYGKRSKFITGILEPIYNLIPNFGNISVFLFSLALLIGCFVLVYYVLPIWYWNSEDRQYVDVTRSILFSSFLYILLSSFFIAKMAKEGCNILEKQAFQYLYSTANIVPESLESSIE